MFMCYARFRQDGLITSGHTANANNALDSWRSAAHSGNKVWRTANRRSPPNPFPAIKLGIFRSLPQAPFFIWKSMQLQPHSFCSARRVGHQRAFTWQDHLPPYDWHVRHENAKRRRRYLLYHYASSGRFNVGSRQ